MIEVEPIGRVETPYSSTDEAPMQGTNVDTAGTITVEAAYADAMDGLAVGDQVVVIWFADEADRSLLRADKRGNRGVFATRSPARPNPICLTTCEIIGIDGTALEVRGVDMLDGSPVLDLKPPLRGSPPGSHDH